jgi:hypothetical protein
MRSRAISLVVWALLAVAGCDSGSGAGDVLFITQAEPDGDGGRVVMEALYEGSVVVRDGCIRLGDLAERHTVVWPPGFRLFALGEGMVLDSGGRQVGQLGSRFVLGGGEVPTLWESGPVEESMRLEALATCPGRYWLVGDVPPAP